MKYFFVTFIPILISCTNPLGSNTYAQSSFLIKNAPVVFAYTGADQSFVVPQGITNIFVKAWGAGGGGTPSITGGTGGAGGYASSWLTVTPGETLTVVVGQGGAMFTAFGSGGGGRSEVNRSGVSLLVAGGGGGASTNGFTVCSGGAG